MAAVPRHGAVVAGDELTLLFAALLRLLVAGQDVVDQTADATGRGAERCALLPPGALTTSCRVVFSLSWTGWRPSLSEM